MATKSLVHLNNNMMVSLDIETTGLRPGFHEIIQIAMIPLDNWLEPRKDLPVFDLKICPEHLGRIDYDSLEVSKQTIQDVMDTGLPSVKVQELFEYWFERLRLPEGKKLVPLGMNIAEFDLQFIQHWLGYKAYKNYFFGHPRDLMMIACYLNDVSDFHAEQTPFNKVGLKDIARKLDIEVLEGLHHDALYDAMLTAQCYKKICFHPLLRPV